MSLLRRAVAGVVEAQGAAVLFAVLLWEGQQSAAGKAADLTY